MVSRKVFNFDNFSEFKITTHDKLGQFTNTISACGCLFKKKDKVLLVRYQDPNWPKLDDFGGQVDLNDDSPEDTIIRETSEETNGKIKLTKEMLSKGKSFYTSTSKYLCVMIEVEDDFFEDTSVFGDHEIVDDIKRTVNWYPISQAYSEICNRLKFNNKLMDYLSR